MIPVNFGLFGQLDFEMAEQSSPGPDTSSICRQSCREPVLAPSGRPQAQAEVGKATNADQMKERKGKDVSTFGDDRKDIMAALKHYQWKQQISLQPEVWTF